MAVIEFEDLPSTDTPINAENLNEIQKANIYSTEEQVVGKWFGKPLYRKCINFPNGTGSTSQVNYTLSDYGINNVDEIYISTPSFYTNSGNRYIFSYNDGNAFEAFVNTTQLKIKLGFAQVANSRCFITLEYTKTTD